MPADDWALGNLTVEFRNEERRARWTSDVEVTFNCDHLPSYTQEECLAFCTCDADCHADADQHLEDCPVEQRLREEFGY